jgi:hypothetical protein
MSALVSLSLAAFDGAWDRLFVEKWLFELGRSSTD